MLALAVALGIGILFITTAMIFHIMRRRSRHSRLANLELRANCLLTRHPIGFVTGPRSVFRPFDHWNDIPGFLREHGYDVIVIEPTSKNPVDSILKALDDLESPCHLIADSSCETELQAISKVNHRAVASLTLVASAELKRNTSRAVTVADLKPSPNLIDTFYVKPQCHLRLGIRRRLALVFLWAHNLLLLGRNRPAVDPVATGEIADLKALEPHLDLAVYLAERDCTLSWSP